jgi:hypothetical protein
MARDILLPNPLVRAVIHRMPVITYQGALTRALTI